MLLNKRFNKNLLTAMDTKLLLPNRFKRVGWLVFVPCFVLTILALLNMHEDGIASVRFFDGPHLFSKWTTINEVGGKDIFDSKDFAGEILMTLTAIGFCLVAFTKERQEDEWISKVRLESLLWGFYGHLFFFFVAIWAGYSLDFYVWLSWNMLVAPLIFLLRFHWLVYVKPYFEERRATA